MSLTQPAPNAKSTSLIEDSASLTTRLAEILGTVVRLGDQLHGPQPRDAKVQGGQAPEPIPTVRRNLDVANGIACDIEFELQRITARV